VAQRVEHHQLAAGDAPLELVRRRYRKDAVAPAPQDQRGLADGGDALVSVESSCLV
jgi:hypothetical protein